MVIFKKKFCIKIIIYLFVYTNNLFYSVLVFLYGLHFYFITGSEFSL